jgi:diguanylate cyclase (GGDEF)-like protein
MLATQATKPQILVIDEDVVTTKLIAKVLSKHQFDVHICHAPEKGLTLLAQHNFNLVLLEVYMSQMSGYVLCEKLRASARNAAIPVIMLTDAHQDNTVELAFQSGATDFIYKPIEWELLYQRIRFALRSYANDDDLRRTRKNLAYAQKLAKLGYLEWNLTQDVFSGSDEVFELFGLTPTQQPTSRQAFLAYVQPESLSILNEQLTQLNARQIDLLQTSIKLTLPNGEHRILNLLAEQKNVTNANETELTLIGSAQDITQLSEARDMIDYMQLHDSLTGLPNRIFFLNALAQRLQRQGNNGYDFVAVMLLDIDRFKLFNQTMGNETGDKVLRTLTDRLIETKRDYDQIARLGSDEFALLINIKPTDQLEEMATRYRNALLVPLLVDDQAISISCSLGIALAPSDSDTAERLIAYANAAKTRAKLHGGNQYQFYTASMNELSARKMLLEQALRTSVKEKQLCLYYQPKVSTLSRQVIGAEALIRWIHPEFGFVNPGDFIQIAEETGIILEIGQWVIEEACRQSAIWRQYDPHFHIAVNLSVRQFQQADLVEKIQDLLARHDLPPQAIDFEITESLTTDNTDDFINKMRQLKALGVKLSIDDFGTGYSNLSYLKYYSADTVKIDRSFIMSIGTSEQRSSDEKLTSAIIAMAHSLDMDLVAEGVENEAQINFLTQMGCEVLQGFYFDKPLPADIFEQKYILST